MFKKVKLFSLLLIGALALGVLVVGCGQETPEVKTEIASPRNLVCKGIVYSNYFAGPSYDQYHVIGPVAGAIVSLVGSYETKSAVTNADGEYVLENIKYGYYRIEATKEGYQRGKVFLYIESAVPDGAIFTEDIDMWINPVMRSVSPLPYSTIETDAVFTVTFNKPMDTSTVRPWLLSDGVRTFAAGDTVSLTTAWSGGETVLTITPSSPLLPNEKYRLYLGPNEFADVKDKEGYKLASSTSTSYGIPVEEQGNVIENNDYFTYYTACGGLPGAPSNLMVTVNSKPFTSEAATGADYVDVYTSGNSVDLYCDPPSSGGPITGYKFYAAIDAGSASNYVLLGSTVNNYYTWTIAQLIYYLYGPGGNNDPISTQNYPFINKAVYFKVVAYNGEGESTQETSTVGKKELITPTLNSTAWDGNGTFTTSYVLDNNYYLPAIDTNTTKAYIFFSEPIDPSTVTASAFGIIVNGGAPARTISSVRLLSNSSNILRAAGPAPLNTTYAVVEIVADGDITDQGGGQNYQIQTTPGMVKDLAGNQVAVGVWTGVLP